MATAKIVILKHQQKEDNTWNVKIRITHERKSAYISTSHYVGIDLINKKTFELKERNNPVYDSIMIDLFKIRSEFTKLGHTINHFTAKGLCARMGEMLSGKDTESINFFDFAYQYAEKLENDGRRIGENYRIATHKFEVFNGSRNVSFSEITSSLLNKYEMYLREIPAKNGGHITDAGIRLYMSKIQAIFNKAKSKYNDEENGVIRISNNPFGNYVIPKTPITRKRALTAKQILAIRDYKCNAHQKGIILARDAFMMSFILVGMNTVDMYYVRNIIDGRIEYERSKTKGRRSDKAFISIRIEPELSPYFERYKDNLNDRIFNFFVRYSNSENFNRKVNENLKSIGEDLGIFNLTYYAARHSWATIARNECGISMDDIATCLNHKSGHDITDTYVKKDWSVIDKANRKVLDFVFLKDHSMDKK